MYIHPGSVLFRTTWSFSALRSEKRDEGGEFLSSSSPMERREKEKEEESTSISSPLLPYDRQKTPAYLLLLLLLLGRTLATSLEKREKKERNSLREERSE